MNEQLTLGDYIKNLSGEPERCRLRCAQKITWIGFDLSRKLKQDWIQRSRSYFESVRTKVLAELRHKENQD